MKLELKKSEQKNKELEHTIDSLRTEKQRLLYVICFLLFKLIIKEKDDLERKVNILKIENNELKDELERALGKTAELANQVGEAEKIKENYKNKMMMLKLEKSKMREEFEEVYKSRRLITVARKKIKSKMNLLERSKD